MRRPAGRGGALAFPLHDQEPEIDFGALAMGSRLPALERVLDGLDLSAGSRREVVRLAKRVASQGFRQPFEFGARLESTERPGLFAVFLGSKPAGYREETFAAPFGRGRSQAIGLGTDVALAWTVDETSRRGVGQGLLSAWKAA